MIIYDVVLSVDTCRGQTHNSNWIKKIIIYFVCFLCMKSNRIQLFLVFMSMTSLSRVPEKHASAAQLLFRHVLVFKQIFSVQELQYAMRRAGQNPTESEVQDMINKVKQQNYRCGSLFTWKDRRRVGHA